MLYQKKGDTVLAGSKMFTVGGEVFANHTCDYGGLFGTVTEIRTGPDQCTERDEPDICCDLQPPESETMVMEIKDRFSALFVGHMLEIFKDTFLIFHNNRTCWSCANNSSRFLADQRRRTSQYRKIRL